MLIVLPVKKKVAEQYSELGDILADNEIDEEDKLRVAFGIETIDNIFEARNNDYESVAIIESNGFFYHVLMSFNTVLDVVDKYRDVVRVV